MTPLLTHTVEHLTLLVRSVWISQIKEKKLCERKAVHIFIYVIRSVSETASVVLHSGPVIGSFSRVEFHLSAHTHTDNWSAERRTTMIN